MYSKVPYTITTPIVIANLLGSLTVGEITPRDARVFLAALVALAARDAVDRTTARTRKKTPRPRRFSAGELASTAGFSERAVCRALGRLKRAGVLAYTESAISVTNTALPKADSVLHALSRSRSPRRVIPVPRHMLRALARLERRATLSVALAYILRGLSLRKGELNTRGSAKISWIAATTGLSERACRYARKELLALGFLSPDTTSHQRKLNRHGAYFSLNLDWERRPRPAPRPPETRTAFAPPSTRPGTPNGSRNQEPRSRTGSLKRAGGKKPSLRSIRSDDLRDRDTLQALFRQAVRERWVNDGEASFRNFTAAAQRALRVAPNDPPRVFVGIVRRGLWHHLTASDEDAAGGLLAPDAAPRREAVSVFAGAGDVLSRFGLFAPRHESPQRAERG